VFEIKEYKDKFSRVYKTISYNGEYDPMVDASKLPKIYVMIMTYNCDDYIKYCIDAFKNQSVDFVFIDNGSTDKTNKIIDDIVAEGKIISNWQEDLAKGDLSYLANKCLEKIPNNSWVFYVNPDEILFDLPVNYLNRLAKFMEDNQIYCGDVRFPDFVNNYSTLFAHFDWGEGAGNYWTARRLFYYTGKERFIHPVHFNVSNVPDTQKTEFNNEHTNEWNGTVARLSKVSLYHYGKLRGAERQRGKEDRLVHGDLIAAGRVATIPFYGRHPSVMNLW
jgi:glycosyltransferase involved in cell wall biosynthesis